jgi:hypothetical protein
MGRCQDYPCCGHESGCCPDFDDSGNQLNMKCTCGATVPLNSRYSLCQSCLNEDSWMLDEGSSYAFDDRDEDHDGFQDESDSCYDYYLDYRDEE